MTILQKYCMFIKYKKQPSFMQLDLTWSETARTNLPRLSRHLQYFLSATLPLSNFQTKRKLSNCKAWPFPQALPAQPDNFLSPFTALIAQRYKTSSSNSVCSIMLLGLILLTAFMLVSQKTKLTRFLQSTVQKIQAKRKSNAVLNNQLQLQLQ